MRKYLILSAALLAAACAKVETEVPLNDPSEETASWTVTVEASKAEKDPETRALVLSSDENAIFFHWGGTDYVSVLDNEENYRGTLSPQTVGGNSTTLSGSISGPVSEGDVFTLLFGDYQRALLASSSTGLYEGQKGTLEDISKNYDYAVATVTATTVDSSAGTVSFSRADFTSKQSISKFSFSYATVYSEGIVKLTVTAPRMETVTVMPPAPGTEFYVAIPSSSLDGKLVYTFMAETESGKVYEATRKANLLAGKCYAATISGMAEYSPIATPLTIEALEDGVITIRNPRNLTILYNAEGQGFSHMSTVYAYDNPIKIPVSAGQRVILGGRNDIYGDTGSGTFYESECSNITCDARHFVYGNVMSLVDWQYYSRPEQNTRVQTAKDRAFAYLFAGDTQLYSHPVKTIELPAATVQYAAYHSMFRKCSNMTLAPELPATTLADAGAFANGCYGAMFEGCTSLVKAPSILPAMTLRTNCYTSMFYGCTSLSASPVLPAKTLVQWSYSYMFVHCSSLKQITCYATNLSANGCLSNWTYGVSSTGVFIRDPESSWPIGPSGIPSGWTYDNVPDPLTVEAIEDGTLTINNPQGLSITWGKSISMAAATTSSTSTISIDMNAGDKIRLWGDNARYGGQDGATYLNTTIRSTAAHYVYGDIRSLLSSSNFPNVSSIGDNAFSGLFHADAGLRSHPSLTLTLGAAAVGVKACDSMFAQCSGLERAPVLPATVLAEGCYESMFSECTALTTAPTLGATALAEMCYAAMFSCCTSLTAAPALPATTLAGWCYGNMFDGCTSLVSAPVLSAATLVPGCYSYMFRDCPSLSAVTCLGTNPTLSDYDEGIEGNVDDWLENTAASGTLTIRSGVVWPSGAVPGGWSTVSR